MGALGGGAHPCAHTGGSGAQRARIGRACMPVARTGYSGGATGYRGSIVSGEDGRASTPPRTGFRVGKPSPVVHQNWVSSLCIRARVRPFPSKTQ